MTFLTFPTPGRVATVCGWGGQIYNLLMSSSFGIKLPKWLKSVHFWRSYSKNKNLVNFWGHSVYEQYVSSSHVVCGKLSIEIAGPLTKNASCLLNCVLFSDTSYITSEINWLHIIFTKSVKLILCKLSRSKEMYCNICCRNEHGKMIEVRLDYV